MKWIILAAIGQWAACCLMATGIAIEVVYRADVGFLALTIGSVLFAAVTKAEYHGRKLIDQKKRNNRPRIDRDSSGGDIDSKS